MRPSRASRFPLWCLMLAGYLSAGRRFVYIGVPPLFISEAYLGWNILRNRGNWLGRFADDVLRFDLLSVAVAANLLWGLVEVFRCLFLGRDPIEVLRTFALSYYPLYLLIGLSIGRELTMSQFVRAWKIMFCIYAPYATIGYVFFVDQLSFSGLPAVMPVAVICLWPYLRDWRPRYIILLAALYPVIYPAGHGRGGFLSLVAGLALVVVASRMSLTRLFAIAATILTFGFIVGPYIPGREGQAPPLDPVVHTARAVATFDVELAKKMLLARGYTQEWEGMESADGTAEWRKRIWRNAFHSLNTSTLLVFGQGGGASIADLVPGHEDIHTPHNFMIFCLYYTGAAGLAVYLFLLLSVFLASRQVENLRLRALLMGVIASTIVFALVGDCFETPYGAVPFYFLCGIVLGFGRRLPAQLNAEGVAASGRTPARLRNSRRVRENMPFAAQPGSP